MRCLAGSHRVWSLFLATRPMFFPASVLPVLVGTAWGWRQSHTLDAGILLAALTGMLCLHGGANVLNDVGDELNGCDRINQDRIAPFTGGSRFIQDGRVTVGQMAAFGVSLLVAAVLVGLAVAVEKGATVLVLGVVGGGLAVAYSLPPFSLASRGLGELAVAVAFGLPVGAAAWLQNAVVSGQAVLAAGAVGCWSAAILIANEVPDRRADGMSGKRTLAVRLGARRTGWLYVGVQSLAALMTVGIVWCAAAPAWMALVPAAQMATAVKIAPCLRQGRDGLLTAIRATLALHMVGGVWLMVLALI